MGNNYFQFKRFRIEQDKCAMKVSTDACIQGAWTPVTSDDKRMLDIGCGTGLLSLMLAQRNDCAQIDAIELDTDAARQAKENVLASDWSDRINVIETDARSFVSPNKYDLIISNPPFFVNSLLGNDEQRNAARHTLSLSFEELFKAVDANLSEAGRVSVLLPTEKRSAWTRILEKNRWSISHQLNVVPVVGRQPNRIISIATRKPIAQALVEDLIIRYTSDQYTPEFIHLLQPFYLKL